MTLRQLYERCPDCNGMGSVSVMDGQGRETEYQCERCVFDGGMVPVEPWWIGVILRDCLPLINDHQVAAVIEALGVGEETP